MATLNKTNNGSLVSDKFIYIEPNYYSSNGAEEQVALEDLSVYVELKVNFQTYGVEKQDNETLTCKWISGSKYVSVYSGVQYDKDVSFLTTDGYGNYTSSLLSNSSTSELFGIESIDISYNSFMVPQVKIKFVDIKGAALFGAEELARNNNGERIDYGNNVKFLSSFFMIPYPRFELYVKGFYGKPIWYDLTASKVVSSFNSKDGNYVLDVDLVGYSYALIGDITMCSLIAAPYSTHGGKDYWENRGFEIDGAPMPTIQEIINSWYGIMGKLDEIGANDETVKQNNVKQVELKLVNDTYEALNDLVAIDMQNKWRKETSSHNIQEIFFDRNVQVLIALNDSAYSFDRDDYEKLSFLRTNGVGYNWSNFKCTSETKVINGNIVSSVYDYMKNEKKIDGVLLDRVRAAVSKITRDSVTVNLCDLRKPYKAILNDKAKKEISFQQVSSKMEENVNQQLQYLLGFDANIKNMTKILFAHLETFLFMYQELKNNKKNNAFPLYTKLNIDKYGVTREEDEWLGNIQQDRYEVKMVEGIISGINNVVNKSKGLILGSKKDFNFIMISPCDLLKKTHPFTNGLNNDILINRLKEIFGLYFYRQDLKPDYFGRIDAQNFCKIHPNGYKNIVQDLLNNNYSFDKIFNKDEFYLFTNIFEYGVVAKKLANEFNSQFIKLGEGDESKSKFQIFDIKQFENKQFATVLIKNNEEIEDLIDINGQLWDSPFFNFDKYINKITGLIVSKSANDNTVRNMPHQGYATFITEKTIIDADGNVKTEKVQDEYGNKSCSNTWKNINNLNIESNADSLTSYILNNDIVFDYKYEDEDGNITNHIVRNVTSDEKIQYFQSSFMKSEYDRVYRVIRCHKNMKEFNYTLITIPSYYINTTDINHNVCINYDTTLFTTDLYKNQKDLYKRALLFLGTFQWGQETIGGKVINDDTSAIWDWEKHFANTFMYNNQNCTLQNCIEVMPKFYVLLIGSILYYYENSNVEYDAFYIEIPFLGQGKKDCLTQLSDTVKKELISYFEKWCEKTYKKWDNAFLYEEEKFKQDGNRYNSSLYYVTLVSNSKIGQLRLFRETHNVVKEMTQEFFTNVIMYKNGLFLYKDNLQKYFYKFTKYQTTSPFIVSSKEWLVKYLNGFTEELTNYFSSEINEEKDRRLGGSVYCNEFISLNMYKYLKAVWDRWIINDSNSYDKWILEDVFEGENKRIHFLDSSYNEIGDLLPINIQKFVDLVQDCKNSNNDKSLLTFLSFFFRDNNCILHNIQNFIDCQNEENIEKIFTPIPHKKMQLDKVKTYSDLIVLYSYQPSETLDDTFNVDDDEQMLPSSIKTKNNNALKIPSFGIEYGMQNQNYFYDIGVSMDVPTMTDQAIQATLKIADENSRNGASDNGNKIMIVGQDMYQVYSNHAYQCNVSMMGCAWIQPLMYFQLMNVPLFRGAYIIHKVQHSITHGKMETKFVGTRVSKKSMKKLDSPFYFARRNLVIGEESVSAEKLANVTNDCNYAFFNPNRENMGVYEKFQMKYGVATYLDYACNLIYKYANDKNLIDAKNSHKLFYILFGFYIYNACVENNNCKIEDILNNGILDTSSLSEIIDNDDITEIKEMLNFIFQNPWDAKIKYSEDYNIDKSTYLNSINEMTLNGTNVDYNVQNVVYFKYGTKIYFDNNTKANSCINIEDVINSINKTLSYLVDYSDVSLEINKGNKMSVYLNASTNDEETKSLIFDAILQAYTPYLSKINWVVDGTDANSIWDKIYISMENNVLGFSTAITDRDNKTLNTTELHSKYYTSLLKKYNFKRLDNKFVSMDNAFKTQCLNFNQICNNTENWEENILSLFEDKVGDVTIIACSQVVDDTIEQHVKSFDDGSSAKFQFVGALNDNGTVKWKEILKEETKDQAKRIFGNASKARALGKAMQQTIADVAFNAKEYRKVKSQVPLSEWKNKQCAKYIRQAFEKVGFDTSGRPNSACRYGLLLEHWGFTKIDEGNADGNKLKWTNFENGDIVVISGIETPVNSKRHGHIQIYYEGLWYADREYNNPNVYKENRLYKLYRFININEQNT